VPFPAYSLTPPCLFLTKIFKLSRTDLVLLSLSSLRRKPALISTLIGRRRRAANCVLTRTGGQQDDAGRHDLCRIRVPLGPPARPLAPKAYGNAIFGIPAAGAGRGHVRPPVSGKDAYLHRLPSPSLLSWR